MKEEIFEDTNGYKRRVLVPDDATPDQYRDGIPLTVEIVEMIDWDDLKIQVNNILVEKGVCDWITLQQTRAMNPIVAQMKRHVQAAIRSIE